LISVPMFFSFSLEYYVLNKDILIPPESLCK
jgi:hypothetical protein